MRRAAVIPIFFAAACSSGPTRPEGAITLAIVNARVWTGDPKQPDAQAVAIVGDRIAAVGTTEEIRRVAGNAEIVDAGGQFLVPGFVDSHVHFLDGGR